MTHYILIKLSTDHATARQFLVDEVASNLESVARDMGIQKATIAAVRWKRSVLAVADVLQSGNQKFNRKRFLLAAGVL